MIYTLARPVSGRSERFAEGFGSMRGYKKRRTSREAKLTGKRKKKRKTNFILNDEINEKLCEKEEGSEKLKKTKYVDGCISISKYIIVL